MVVTDNTTDCFERQSVLAYKAPCYVAVQGRGQEYFMETIKGFIEHIIYRNHDNGYTVLNLMGDGEEITCVGFFKTMDQGETIEAQGEYITHQVYGRQFKIEHYKILPPDDVVSIERYLGSGAIRGVGEALAARIVKMFGVDTYRIIEEEPERLAEVKGISIRKAREIAVTVYEKRDAREAMTFLQTYGISNTLAIRIYETYGLNLYGIMKENPYRLAEDIHGIGFRIADEIAARIGIHTDSDYRIRSGILYTLQRWIRSWLLKCRNMGSRSVKSMLPIIIMQN